MKVSIKWLEKYFDAPLPPAEAIADAFTFHAFEIEEAKGDMLDVKVLPNRSADCLSHRGLAKELSAILDVPMKKDPLRESLPSFPTTDTLTIDIEDPKKCSRYMGAIVRGVKVEPSPAWLKQALQAVGQKSINNIVDATNYVMLNIGQPLHVFDADKLKKDMKYAIAIREAAGPHESVTVLSGEGYLVPEGGLLVTDGNTRHPIAIAGIKGGIEAITELSTTNILIEAANFDGVSVRRTAQALKLFTDASLRFQNKPSPELAAYGMRDVLELIKEVAGGELVGVVDVYPKPPASTNVSTTTERVNATLGSDFSSAEIADVFKRLDLATKVEGDTFTVTPPFERTDLVIPEDLAEEVGQIMGYDKVPSKELPPAKAPGDQSRFRGIERMKDSLVDEGFIEVSTQSFVKKGPTTLANPLDVKKPALRTSLEENLMEALERAKRVAPLALGPNVKPKLFEVGSVFPESGEYLELRMTERVPAWGEAVGTFDNLTVAKLEDYGKDYEPKRISLGLYKPFSIYPFVLRDIALWTPAGTESSVVAMTIKENAGPLLVRLDEFDRFEKDGRISFAFRLVFESNEKTLTDDEVNVHMQKVTEALAEKGFEVR